MKNDSMLKALHHTQIAMQYFEDISKELSGTQKHIMLGFASKCNWIIQNVRTKLSKETLEKLDSELRDSLFLEELESQVLKFNEQQRGILENIVTLINKGENIDIIQNH